MEGESENKIIQGDNLLALKSLLPEYAGKVKCIYIDPPYNTGNEGWVYNDNVNDPKIKKWLGQVVGKEGEDLSRHDKWLCMMYPRLVLLQRLLAEDGAIFISIDDNEQASLRLICDEIFGVNNFVANIVWKKKTNGNNMGHIPPVHDFILAYAKSVEQLAFSGLSQDENYIRMNYANPDNHPRGLWTTSDLSANHKGPYFPITNPLTGEQHFPPKGRYWVFNEEEVLQRINDGKIIFGKTGTTKPVQRVFLVDRETRNKPETWFDKQGFNSDGMKILTEIFGGKVLDHPKPPNLICHILNFATKPGDIILDSFAGSGTTAHAVLNLNKQDGGNRKFILVEMMDYAESITAERVRRVINGYGNTPGTGGGFSYYTLGEPLFDQDANVSAKVTEDTLRTYVYFMETKQRLPKRDKQDHYLLGVYADTAYYFYYKPGVATTLNTAFLNALPPSSSRCVIYASRCTVSREELNQRNITFKKIPRDISRL